MENDLIEENVEEMEQVVKTVVVKGQFEKIVEGMELSEKIAEETEQLVKIAAEMEQAEKTGMMVKAEKTEAKELVAGKIVEGIE